MASSEVTIARIYLTEQNHLLKALISRLHDQEQVKGVTVLRGISGFGHSGKIHTAELLELSTDLPLIVEFFDEPARVAAILDDLAELLKGTPVVTLAGRVHEFD